VSQAAYDDLKANAGTIESALLRFSSNVATGMTLDATGPEPK